MTSGAPRAPLLAVVGGPTGAGKSTLLNSLVRAPVSAAGVLRPTTRRPVLVCNPRDWASVRRHGLRPICAPMMPEGIAVIDAPDIDSIEPGNRALAEELFAEADLWLFVTTASRYADAANWRHLRAARERRVALAVVLDRVGAGHAQGIIDHMRDLLGPPEPPLFVIPEATLDRQGMLPDSITAPLRGWLADVVEAARTGPPQPAIGVAHVPAGNIASPADRVPADAASAQESADATESVTAGVTPQGYAGDTGLTVELEITHAPPAATARAGSASDRETADSPTAPPPAWPAGAAFGTAESDTAGGEPSDTAWPAGAAFGTAESDTAEGEPSDTAPSVWPPGAAFGTAESDSAEGEPSDTAWPAGAAFGTGDFAHTPSDEVTPDTYDIDAEPEAVATDADTETDKAVAANDAKAARAAWHDREDESGGVFAPHAQAEPDGEGADDAAPQAQGQAQPDADDGDGESGDGPGIQAEVTDAEEDEDYGDAIEYELDLTEETETPEAYEGDAPDGDGDGVPDTELTPAAPLTSDDVEAAEEAEEDAEEEAQEAADADAGPDVVESDPPDGRPADIPKAADVGETVKL